MTPKPGIPANLEGEVLAQAGANLSVRQIADWLATAHGVKVGSATVARFLAKHRAERADVAKAVVREQLGKTLNADISRLEEIRAGLAKRSAKLTGKKDFGAFARLVELELKAIDRKLHYAGADDPDEKGSARAAVIVLPPEE
jgi:hypothetical protein